MLLTHVAQSETKKGKKMKDNSQVLRNGFLLCLQIWQFACRLSVELPTEIIYIDSSVF